MDEVLSLVNLQLLSSWFSPHPCAENSEKWVKPFAVEMKKAGAWMSVSVGLSASWLRQSQVQREAT